MIARAWLILDSFDFDSCFVFESVLHAMDR